MIDTIDHQYTDREIRLRVYPNPLVRVRRAATARARERPRAWLGTARQRQVRHVVSSLLSFAHGHEPVARPSRAHDEFVTF